MGQIIKDSSPLRENFTHALMGFLDEPRDLFVNLSGFRFTENKKGAPFSFTV